MSKKGDHSGEFSSFYTFFDQSKQGILQALLLGLFSFLHGYLSIYFESTFHPFLPSRAPPYSLGGTLLRHRPIMHLEVYLWLAPFYYLQQFLIGKTRVPIQ